MNYFVTMGNSNKFTLQFMGDKIMTEHIVAKSSEIANGTGQIFELEGKKIAVFNVDGNFVAIDNTCKHKGGSLGEGSLENKTVTCPLHRWQYDVTTGQCLNNPGVQVDSYTVKVEGDEITLVI